MRRAIAVFTLLVGAGLPASAVAGGLELRIGGFFPRANTGAFNDLFTDHSDLYNVGRSDWRGVSGGIEYSHRLARNVELGVHLDVYERTLDTHYRKYTRLDDSEIFQTLRLNVVPVGVSLRVVPTSRRARLAPYLTAGADLFIYRYEAFGDFIDFGTADRDIFYDSFVTNGVAPGFHVAGGLRVPISDDFSITGEYRYQVAEDDMGGDFKENRIDLSGGSFTVGLHLRF
jgi:opacity protein-like surface antigen